MWVGRPSPGVVRTRWTANTAAVTSLRHQGRNSSRAEVDRSGPSVPDREIRRSCWSHRGATVVVLGPPAQRVFFSGGLIHTAWGISPHV